MDKKLTFPQILHLGYVVADRDAAVLAYEKIMGVTNFSLYEFAPESANCMGEIITDCCLKIAMGTTETGMVVELIEPVTGKTPHAKFLIDGHEGLHHIAYRVPNFEEWKEYLLSIDGAKVVFAAKAEDEIRGSRQCLYVELPGISEIIEVSSVPVPYKK